MMKLENLPVKDLKPFAKNPRINDHAVAAVARSIEEFGFNCPIVIDPDNRICAGHTRLKAAMKLGLETVPVLRVDSLTAEKFVAFNIADNQTASLAFWDDDVLPDLINELKDSSIDLKNLGFPEQELKRLMLENDDAFADNDSRLEESEIITQDGDLYEMGAHRLLCEDSCSSEAFAYLTKSEKIDCVIAGPAIFGQLALSNHSDYEEYLKDMCLVAKNCIAIMNNGRVMVWHIGNCSITNHDNISHLSIMLKDLNLKYLDTIVWAKTTANYGVGRNCHIQQTGHYYPAFQWDALLVYQKSGKMPKMSRDGKEYMAKHHTNLWELPCEINSLKRYGHPAACPVEIPYRIMQAYTKP